MPTLGMLGSETAGVPKTYITTAHQQSRKFNTTMTLPCHDMGTQKRVILLDLVLTTLARSSPPHDAQPFSQITTNDGIVIIT